MRILVKAFLFTGLASPALACVPPPPPLRLQGESDTAYRQRSDAFFTATIDEGRRAFQTRLFDTAKRVTLARVASTAPLGTEKLADGSLGYAVELQPVIIFKGDAANRNLISLQDTDITSCGRYAGDGVTAKPGEYVVMFEQARIREVDRDYGLLLRDLREPRILVAFDKRVQEARADAGR